MRRWNRVQLTPWLLLAVALTIVYGSLYPFHFSPAGTHGLADLMQRLPWARTTRSDVAANVLLYLPLGACLGWWLAARLGGPLAILLATLLGSCLALGIETAQIFETRRVASLADAFYNGIGSLLGAALALALRSARHGARSQWFAGPLREPIACALLLLWIGFRLAPFALSLDPEDWRAALLPVFHGGWLVPLEALRYLVPWLVVGEALSAVLTRRDPLLPFAALVLAVVAGLVVVIGRELLPAELLGMALALALLRPLLGLAPRQRAALLAVSIALLIAIQGLAPFDFRVDPDAFGLVPFSDALTRYRATNLPDMFEKCFLYGSLVWLLARAGARILHATLLAATWVLAIELLQTWLPGQLAEITDPLLVLIAGGLISLFDGGAGTGASNRRLWRH